MSTATMSAATMNAPTTSAAESPAMVPAPGASKLADNSPMPPAAAKTTETSVAPPAEARTASAMPPSDMVAAQQPPALAASGAAADVLPAATPLSGPIPLPRHRPRDLGEMRMAEMAPITAATVPMPRRRPDAAGPSAPAADAGSGSPLGFLQNLFGSK
jgi:hypothetical protein